jgi:hypothetical protein
MPSARAGEGQVSIAGSRAGENWELRVEGPNGFERSYTLAKETGEHAPEAILQNDCPIVTEFLAVSYERLIFSRYSMELELSGHFLDYTEPKLRSLESAGSLSPWMGPPQVGRNLFSRARRVGYGTWHRLCWP